MMKLKAHAMELRSSDIGLEVLTPSSKVQGTRKVTGKVRYFKVVK